MKIGTPQSKSLPKIPTYASLNLLSLLSLQRQHHLWKFAWSNDGKNNRNNEKGLISKQKFSIYSEASSLILKSTFIVIAFTVSIDGFSSLSFIASFMLITRHFLDIDCTHWCWRWKRKTGTKETFCNKYKLETLECTLQFYNSIIVPWKKLIIEFDELW